MSRLENLKLDRVPLTALLVGFVAVVFLIGLTMGGTYRVFLSVGIDFMFLGLILLGLNLQFGLTGMPNFGPVLFYAVGAYTVAWLAAVDPSFGIGLGLPWPFALVMGVVVTLLAAILLSFVIVRLKPEFLAIVTLVTAEIFHDLSKTLRSITGGDIGILDIPRPVHGWINEFELFAVFIILGVVLLGSYSLLVRIGDSPYGRVLKAIRADEQATQAAGKNTTWYKIMAFSVGSAFAGLAGGLFALYNGVIAPSFFTIDVTVAVWIGLLLGGAGNFRAALGGLATIESIEVFTRFLNVGVGLNLTFEPIRLLTIGLIMILVIRFRPGGLWGDKHMVKILF